MTLMTSQESQLSIKYLFIKVNAQYWGYDLVNGWFEGGER